MMKPGMLSRPTDLDGFRRLMDLKMSVSEIGAKVRSFDDDEREGKIPGKGLLYCDVLTVGQQSTVETLVDNRC
jgi:hypothetical protein